MLVVTGASGFLGRALVARAAARGLPVTAVSRQPLSAVPGVRAIRVEDYSQLQLSVPDTVLIHLAEEADIAKASALGEDHIARTQGAFAALVAKGWKHVVYASSGVVYGDKETYPRREDEPVYPEGVYGRAKRACEEIAVAVRGTALRLGNVYGAGMPRRVVMSDIIENIHATGPLRLHDLSVVRDFIHVDDVADGFLAAAQRKPAGIHNLASGTGTSVAALGKIALAAAGQQGRAIEQIAAVSGPSQITLDVTRIRQATGWQSQIDLETGLGRLVKERR